MADDNELEDPVALLEVEATCSKVQGKNEKPVSFGDVETTIDDNYSQVDSQRSPQTNTQEWETNSRWGKVAVMVIVGNHSQRSTFFVLY